MDALMRGRTSASFANMFLVPDGDKAVLKVDGPNEAWRRSKKPHTKSRFGCIACKRRKVKCNEQYPCSNCIKRHETCVQPKGHSAVGPVAAASPRIRQPPDLSELLQGGDGTIHLAPELAFNFGAFERPPGHADGPVNMLHMELFHHFEKHTVQTLSFDVVWPKMLQLSYREEHPYLMHAILSLAATHLTHLKPDSHRYCTASLSLLSRSLESYRAALSRPITAANCDAMLATCVLIHYMAWCNLTFLDGQHLDAVVADGGGSGNSKERIRAPLDLSLDQLFLLSSGIRQVFFLAWPMLLSTGSVFLDEAMFPRCMALEDVLLARGVDWRPVRQRLLDMYDDPGHHGARGGRKARTASPPDAHSSAPSSSAAPAPSPAGADPTPDSTPLAQRHPGSLADYITFPVVPPQVTASLSGEEGPDPPASPLRAVLVPASATSLSFPVVPPWHRFVLDSMRQRAAFGAELRSQGRHREARSLDRSWAASGGTDVPPRLRDALRHAVLKDVQRPGSSDRPDTACTTAATVGAGDGEEPGGSANAKAAAADDGDDNRMAAAASVLGPPPPYLPADASPDQAAEWGVAYRVYEARLRDYVLSSYSQSAECSFAVARDAGGHVERAGDLGSCALRWQGVEGGVNGGGGGGAAGYGSLQQQGKEDGGEHHGRLDDVELRPVEALGLEDLTGASDNPLETCNSAVVWRVTQRSERHDPVLVGVSAAPPLPQLQTNQQQQPSQSQRPSSQPNPPPPPPRTTITSTPLPVRPGGMLDPESDAVVASALRALPRDSPFVHVPAMTEALKRAAFARVATRLAVLVSWLRCVREDREREREREREGKKRAAEEEEERNRAKRARGGGGGGRTEARQKRARRAGDVGVDDDDADDALHSSSSSSSASAPPHDDPSSSSPSPSSSSSPSEAWSDPVLARALGGANPGRRDLERYFLSFPVLCFGPFLPLILTTDTRACAVLLHLYRAASELLGPRGAPGGDEEEEEEVEVVEEDVGEGGGADEEDAGEEDAGVAPGSPRCPDHRAEIRRRREAKAACTSHRRRRRPAASEPADASWWALRRAGVMERYLAAELRARGRAELVAEEWLWRGDGEDSSSRPATAEGSGEGGGGVHEGGSEGGGGESRREGTKKRPGGRATDEAGDLYMADAM